jgi:hypothetical protein
MTCSVMSPRSWRARARTGPEWRPSAAEPAEDRKGVSVTGRLDATINGTNGFFRERFGDVKR